VVVKEGLPCGFSTRFLILIGLYGWYHSSLAWVNECSGMARTDEMKKKKKATMEKLF
jgi:hypothetical protein